MNQPKSDAAPHNAQLEPSTPPVVHPRKAEANSKVQQPKGNNRAGPSRLEKAGIFAAIVVALTSIWQGYLTRESNEFTRKALIASSRAWIVFQDFGSGFDPNNPHPVQMNVSNVGHSPAITEKMAVAIKVVPSKLTELPILDLEPNVMVFPPGLPLGMVNDPGVISQEDAICLTRGQSTAYAIGMIEYRDQFSSGHRTGFCLEWHRDKNIWLPCPFPNAFVLE